MKTPMALKAVLTILFFLFGVEACALKVATPSPTPTPKVATTLAIPVLEPGQSWQFPGLLVQLRRLAWKENTVDSYWLVENNGTKKIENPVNMLQFRASDQTGNEGQFQWIMSPEWDTSEGAMKDLMHVAALLPGQKAVYFLSWQFSPLVKGIQIAVTFISEGKVYGIKWNTGR